jgi:hypothetical protein
MLTPLRKVHFPIDHPPAELQVDFVDREVAENAGVVFGQFGGRHALRNVSLQVVCSCLGRVDRVRRRRSEASRDYVDENFVRLRVENVGDDSHSRQRYDGCDLDAVGSRIDEIFPRSAN